MQQPPTSSMVSPGRVSPGHRLEAWRVNAIQDRVFRHNRVEGPPIHAGYDGPWAGYADGQNIKIEDGYVFWNGGFDSPGATSAVDLSAYASATVFVYLKCYNVGGSYDFTFPTVTVFAGLDDEYGSPIRSVLLGVAITDANGYPVSWTQHQYGNVDFGDAPVFKGATLSANYQTLNFGSGKIRVGNTSWNAPSDSVAPGASNSGYIYYAFTAGATTSTIAYTTTNALPAAAAGTTHVVFGYYTSNADSEITAYVDIMGRIPGVMVIRSYDPATDTSTTQNGWYTPLILEATGLAATFDTGGGDSQIVFRNGGAASKA